MFQHFKKLSLVAAIAVACGSMLVSCGSGRRALVVPYAVSTAASTSIEHLDLKPGQYDVLKVVDETASVSVKYGNNSIKITDSEGSFSYEFKFDMKSGWRLKYFSGAAEMGYFTSDYTSSDPINLVTNPDEFARRLAMARVIKAAGDYHADGILEPITTTTTNNGGKNTVVYTSTVRAKLVIIKPSK